jgi:hypothetical protein
MKNFLSNLFVSLFCFISFSCSNSSKEVTVKLTGCDSLSKNLISNLKRVDSLRLLSCLKLSGCDSVSLGILKPTNDIALRLNCLVGVGENIEGGIVIIVDSNFKHGVVMSKIDALPAQFVDGGMGIPFFDKLIGASSLDDGISNTNKILAYSPNAGAAAVCATFVNSGFDDWYLPSINELIKLSKFRDLTFSSRFNGQYWSSTEFSSNGAWMTDLLFASYGIGVSAGTVKLKIEMKNIRPVRRF